VLRIGSAPAIPGDQHHPPLFVAVDDRLGSLDHRRQAAVQGGLDGTDGLTKIGGDAVLHGW